MAALPLLTPSRRSLVGLVLLIGGGLSLFIWHNVARQEARIAHNAFLSRAQTQATVAAQRLRNYQEMVLSMRDAFGGQNTVTRQEFANVAHSHLERHSGVLALQWVPIVSHETRAAHEQLATEELGRPYVIRRRLPDGSLQIAPEAPEYFVITYAEPIAGNEIVLGYDISSAPTNRIIEIARTERKFKVSQPFRLLQSTDPQAENGIVFIAPFTRGGLPGHKVEGFVQGVFLVQTMLAQSHSLNTNDALDSYYFDTDPDYPEPKLLYANLAGIEPLHPPGTKIDVPSLNDPADFHRTIEIGGRQWKLVIKMNETWAKSVSTNQPLIILAAGLTITALLALFANLLLQRTSRIEAEVQIRTRELHATEARLQSILDHSPALIFLKDLEGRYLLCNELFATLCQRPHDEIIGKRDDELFPPEQAKLYLDHDIRVIRSQLSMDFEEFAITPAGPRTRIVQKFLLFDDRDQAYAICGIATDITERKAGEEQRLVLERQMLEGQKLESLGVLAGGIAHDFNNILTAILGNATLANMELPEHHRVRNNIQQIENASRRAADLCSQMLAYAGKAAFITAPVDIGALVSDTVSLLEISVGKRTRLELKLGKETPAVLGDITQLRQILMNLVINASDSIGDRTDGNIAVTTITRELTSDYLKQAVQSPKLPPGRYVGLEVSDNGSGMPPEVLTRIFEPFFTTKFSGRGLGLAAVLGIIQSHDGALFVESEPSQGTTFRIFFPACESKVDPTKTGLNTVAAPVPLKGTVLVVDDESAVRRVATKALGTIGLKTLEAPDGKTAIRLYGEMTAAGIDLVLLDMMMPGLTGEETFQQLKQINPTVRVIIMSGFSENETMQRCAFLGPVGFLAKPFEITALIERLRPHLG